MEAYKREWLKLGIAVILTFSFGFLLDQVTGWDKFGLFFILIAFMIGYEIYFTNKLKNIAQEGNIKQVRAIVEKDLNKEIVYEGGDVVIYKEVCEEGYLRFFWEKPKYRFGVWGKGWDNKDYTRLLCFRDVQRFPTRLTDDFVEKGGPIISSKDRSGSKEDFDIQPGILYFYIFLWYGDLNPFKTFDWKAPGRLEEKESIRKNRLILECESLIPAFKEVSEFKAEFNYKYRIPVQKEKETELKAGTWTDEKEEDFNFNMEQLDDIERFIIRKHYSPDI